MNNYDFLKIAKTKELIDWCNQNIDKYNDLNLDDIRDIEEDEKRLHLEILGSLIQNEKLYCSKELFAKVYNQISYPYTIDGDFYFEELELLDKKINDNFYNFQDDKTIDSLKGNIDDYSNFYLNENNSSHYKYIEKEFDKVKKDLNYLSDEVFERIGFIEDKQSKLEEKINIVIILIAFVLLFLIFK